MGGLGEYPQVEKKSLPPRYLSNLGLFLLSVPLEPRSPKFREVTATSITLTWKPPSNAPNLGKELLGYRIYLTAKSCLNDNSNNNKDNLLNNEQEQQQQQLQRGETLREKKRRLRRLKQQQQNDPLCRSIPPVTVNSGRLTTKNVRGLCK